jgi:hypothetical protein
MVDKSHLKEMVPYRNVPYVEDFHLGLDPRRPDDFRHLLNVKNGIGENPQTEIHWPHSLRTQFRF